MWGFPDTLRLDTEQDRYLYPSDDDSGDERFNKGKKRAYFVEQVTRALEAGLVARHRLDALILPRFEPGARSWEIQRVPFDQVVALLERQCFTADDPTYFDWLGVLPAAPGLDTLRATYARLADLPALAVRGNYTPDDGRRAILEFLEELER